MVFAKKFPFFQLFFLGNIAQENVFYDILEQKNAFVGHKNKRLKNSKKWPFFKGVNPWFWSKNDHFYPLFLANIGEQNVFYDILERKNAFLSYKNYKFKKSKNWHFSKGFNPWFWSKNGHFFLKFFILGNIRQENVFYDILEQKNAFVGYENKKLKNSKYWHFSRGVNPWFRSRNGHFSNFFF